MEMSCLTLYMRGQSYLGTGITRSISWLLMPWLLMSPGHQQPWYWLRYVEKVGSCLIWGRISTTCIISMWRNDTKCKYMFMFPLKNLARKGLNACKYISLGHMLSDLDRMTSCYFKHWLSQWSHISHELLTCWIVLRLYKIYSHFDFWIIAWIWLDPSKQN